MGKRSRGNLIGCVVLGVIQGILVWQVPRILAHTSNPELHQSLYFGKSLAYWLFVAGYLSLCLAGALLWLALLLNRSLGWTTAPVMRFLSTRRTFTWSEVVIVVLITLVLAAIPEVLARAVFVTRYAAPATILIPYRTRFDRTMALYGYTRRAGDAAQGDVAVFRDNTFVYRPYVGFSTIPPFRPTPAPEKSAFRVFFVGGSAMQISAAPTLRDLRLRLSDLGCNVEVINAGRSGYVSGQELVMLLMEILELQPDLVVVFDGYNDITRVEEGEEPGAPEFSHAMEAAFTAGSRPYEHALNDLTQRSFFVQFLAGRFGREAASGPARGREQAFERAVELYAANLQRMARIAGSYQTGLIVAIQPTVYLRDSPGPLEVELVARSPERAALYQRYFPRLIEGARTIGRNERVPVHDLSRVFAEVPGDVFYDGVHFYGAQTPVREALRREFENLILSFPGACERQRQ